MHAMEIHDGALRATTAPEPEPGPGELRIRVAYAGVNHADMLQVAGKYPPPEGASPLPGMEVSGIVDAVGPGVSLFRSGDRVCALIGGGGYAEYAIAPAAQCLAVPPTISLKQAAAIPEAAATAYMALEEEAQLQPGETILLHGGTSGVGLMMGQVAKAWGAKVIATVGSDEKCQFLHARGITPINHQTAPFEEEVKALTQHAGVDVVIDTLGAPKLPAHLQILKVGGRLVMLAMLEGPKLPDGTKLGAILLKHLQIRGTTLRSRNPQEKAKMIEGVRKKILPHIVAGTIELAVAASFPLAEAQKAHEAMQQRLHMGKIVLEVTPQE